jgi:divalent metal cation (Fe/Co/Zn/Cd) transporter
VRLRTVGPRNFVDVAIWVPRTMALDRIVKVKAQVQDAVARVVGDADVVVTANPMALDSETVTERVMVIARNLGLAVHHATVYAIAGRLAISLDLEVDGALSLRDAHAIADRLEAAVGEELGPNVEVETHIEPLEPADQAGRDAAADRHEQVRAALAELAGDAGPIREVHDVRVRDTEAGELVNFHCYVNPRLTVHEVHERVDDLERALRRRWPSIKRVIGHAEPRGADAPALPGRTSA